MTDKIGKLVFVLIILLFLPRVVFGAGVVINEVAWAGTTEDWRYEWIELFNDSGGAVDVSGWQIENGASGSKTLILSSGAIPANTCFLICRKEMTGCDLIETKLSLHNEYDKNGQLILRDNANNLIDAAPLPENSAWPGGGNKTKQTMQKCADAWGTSPEPNGTPKAQNQCPSPEPASEHDAASEPEPTPLPPAETILPESTLPELVLLPEPEPEQPPEMQPLAPQPIQYPDNIFINEILPSPEGADSENEWLELYNGNDFEVNLEGWQIQDIVGQTKTYTFPAGRTTIPVLGFLLCPRTQTNITLQNSGDTIELLNPNQEIIDSATYPKAAQGQSYNKTSQEWTWSITLTPGAKNIITPAEIPADIQAGRLANILTDNQTDQPTDKDDVVQEKALADTSASFPHSSHYLLIFIIAIIIALGSAIIALFLKKKTEPEI